MSLFPGSLGEYQEFLSIFKTCGFRQKEFLGTHPRGIRKEVPFDQLEPGKIYIKHTGRCTTTFEPEKVTERTIYVEADRYVIQDWYNATRKCLFPKRDADGKIKDE